MYNHYDNNQDIFIVNSLKYEQQLFSTYYIIPDDVIKYIINIYINIKYINKTTIKCLACFSFIRRGFNNIIIGESFKEYLSNIEKPYKSYNKDLYYPSKHINDINDIFEYPCTIFIKTNTCFYGSCIINYGQLGIKDINVRQFYKIPLNNIIDISCKATDNPH